MSGTQRRAAQAGAQDEDEEGGAGGAEGGAEATLEERARLQGWRPLSEFRGDPAVWRSAEEYLARGEQELPLLRERMQVLEQRALRAERAAQRGVEVITDVSERMRRADERAMVRARQELARRQREAVESGDVEQYDATTREITDLEKDGQGGAAGSGAAAAAAAAAAPGAVVPPQEVVAWAARNPWFQEDDQLRAAATQIHQNLLISDPDMSLADNLARVSLVMQTMYPTRVRGAARPKPRQEEQEVQRGNEEEEAVVEQRRAQPARVAGSREMGARRASPHSFDAMPQDSKEAFARYKTAIDRKGGGGAKPLTKEEWAANYWEQE